MQNEDILYSIFNFQNIKRKIYTKEYWVYLDKFETKIKDDYISDNLIKLNINNEICKFNRIFNEFGSTSKYYCCKNKYFIKYPFHKENGMLERENFILNKLKEYKHFPKVVKYTENFIVLTWCGERLNSSNVPQNIFSQVEEICNALQIEKINHTDIKDEELLVKDGVLYLVDFGWGRYMGRHDCGLNIPNISLAENKFIDDKQCLIDVIERIQNPLLFLKKNKLLKNHKNVKWLGYKNMSKIGR